MTEARACEAKACESVTVCCEDVVPNICGVKHLTLPDHPCDSIYFTGLTDITVTQGDEVDLDSGVHAYDANGGEIEFRHTSVDTDECGTFYALYTAQGAGHKLSPHFFCVADERAHIVSDDCGVDTLKKWRKVIVEPSSDVCTATVCCATIAC